MSNDDLEQLLERPMHVARGDLVDLQMLMHKIASDKKQDNDVRDQADQWVGVLNEILVYGGGELDLAPVGLGIKDHYQIIYEMTVAELPAAVKASMPGRLAMARTMAEGADDISHGTDYRLDCVNALERLLVGFQSQTDDDE